MADVEPDRQLRPREPAQRERPSLLHRRRRRARRGALAQRRHRRRHRPGRRPEPRGRVVSALRRERRRDPLLRGRRRQRRTQLWTLHGCGSAAEPCAIVRLPLPDQPPSSSGVPYLVKDMNPGPGDGAPYDMTDVGGTAFFQAYRPDTGVELWASDGTEAGTRLVRDLNPGPDGLLTVRLHRSRRRRVLRRHDDRRRRGAVEERRHGSRHRARAGFRPARGRLGPRDLTVAGGRLWFFAPGDGGNAASCGAPTAPAAHVLFPHPSRDRPPYSAGTLGALGDTLFFTAYDFTEPASRRSGRRTARPAGTSRLPCASRSSRGRGSRPRGRSSISGRARSTTSGARMAPPRAP